MNWITALSQLSADSVSYVLLTVLDTRGSSPRDVGTKMIVSRDEIFDTIGGGALEHQCIELAREFLVNNQDSRQHTESFNLGKDLKQCCGGVVSVLFEVFPASEFTINIFGSGHIGNALTKVLSDIDCTVNLFDSREALFQDSYPSHVKTHSLDKPELAVEACAPNSYFLVMTHDHALDQQLCEAIIARGDSRYCGVIGSRTKGIKFGQRLKKKGFTKNEIKHLSCPMGLTDLKTKKPMEIAISITAELLILRDKARNHIDQNLDDEGVVSMDDKIIRLEINE